MPELKTCSCSRSTACSYPMVTTISPMSSVLITRGSTSSMAKMPPNSSPSCSSSCSPSCSPSCSSSCSPSSSSSPGSAPFLA